MRFCKKSKLFIVLALLSLATLVILALGRDKEEINNKSQRLTTPALIENAYNRGEINEAYKYLYLTYAIYDYEALPQEYQSNVTWDGTSVVKEIKEKINSQEFYCSLESKLTKEFNRLFKLKIKCP